MYKEGDWVKFRGTIGRIIRIETLWAVSTDWSGEDLLYIVRVPDQPKWARDRYAQEGEMEPYSFKKNEAVAESVDYLTDWLSSPKEKLRNALEVKENRLANSNLRRGRIRMDGRKS